jgi:ATP-dependent Clp protease ATP-binding subunit ClpC
MYERFTDRARKVMALANQEAQRFNHEYIGTEHILLGLLKEDRGTAIQVLKNLGFDVLQIKVATEAKMKAGPETTSLGKFSQTPRAKRVIEYAVQESVFLNHNYIGTEHLLLGLLREYDGTAMDVLTNVGVQLETTREEVLSVLATAPPMPSAVSEAVPVTFGVSADVDAHSFLLKAMQKILETPGVKSAVISYGGATLTFEQK